MNNERALITGSSSGIGLELAREFAAHGHPLFLTAPVEEELKQIAESIRMDFHVDVDVHACDLREPSAADSLYEFSVTQGKPVDVLVNNAGLGQRGKFWETPLDRDLTMIRVNIEAVVRLTKLFLPSMIAKQYGRILNTASVAGFEPGPLLAVYHATKAFVLSFSEAIATELEGTGVQVTALCPGATATDFFAKADMLSTNAVQRGSMMTPREVAQQGYEALMSGERVHVTGGVNKALVFSRRILSESAQARFNRKLYEEAPQDKRKRDPQTLEKKAA